MTFEATKTLALALQPAGGTFPCFTEEDTERQTWAPISRAFARIGRRQLPSLTVLHRHGPSPRASGPHFRHHAQRPA